MSKVEASRIRTAVGAGLADEAAASARRLLERAEREGLADVAYATYDSPVGTGVVAATARGVVAVGLPGRSIDELLEELAADVSPRVLELPMRLDRARRELDEYFEGRRRAFDLTLDWALVTPGFYTRVLEQTAKLPFGVTSTYGEIAAEAGNPRAHRAAGTALGRNPLPLIIPCHRILRAGGEIGNYGGGRALKEWLLRLEGAIGD